MRAAALASLLCLAFAAGAARAEGVRLTAQGERVAADAMSVYGRVCRPPSAALPEVELRIVDRRGAVVAIQPLALHEPAGAADGCAYYRLAVAVGLTEAAEVCITGVGGEAAAYCAPRLRG